MCAEVINIYPVVRSDYVDGCPDSLGFVELLQGSSNIK